MTDVQMAKGHSTLGWTLAVMLSLSLIMSLLDERNDRQRREMRELRQEAARERVVLEKETIYATPTARWFEYHGLEQAGDVAPPEGPLVMQSQLAVHEPTMIRYNVALRCRPAGGGPERTISANSSEFAYATPTVFGYADVPGAQAGYKRRDGQWTYSGRLPRFDADCLVTVRPCATVKYDIKKCSEVESGVVKIRAASAD